MSIQTEDSQTDRQKETWTVCTCNACSGNMEFDATRAGETVQCPHCRQDTVLFVPNVPAASGSPVAALVQQRKAKIAERTSYHGGLEDNLANIGAIFLVFGCTAGFCALVAGFFEQGAFWFAIGVAAIGQAWIIQTLLKAGAEIIRLLKKSNGLRFSGEISQPATWTVYRCSACGRSVENNSCVKCPGCGREFGQ